MTARLPYSSQHKRSPTSWCDQDGYLQLICDADRDAGEVSYLDMQTAIERVVDGESYQSLAAETSHLSRVTLMDIHKEDDRRA